jgi:molybdenum cofactor cytidylyltransferase
LSLNVNKDILHVQGKLEKAITEAESDIVLILTASATSDISDVAPMAIKSLGGKILRFGLPVDPGNLLFLGELNGKPIIGLPGCAKSPAVNGADWVISRVVCGHTPNKHEFARMGLGGLLKETGSRPMPRLESGIRK